MILFLGASALFLVPVSLFALAIFLFLLRMINGPLDEIVELVELLDELEVKLP